MNPTKNIKSLSCLFKNTVVAALMVTAFLLAGALGVARAQIINEGFENITTLPAAGWFAQNNSTPVGTTGWFQGSNAVFSAQAGTANSYIGANFNNTTGANTISNWLLTPNLTLHNGAVIKFWTRETTANLFPNRLEVRLSTSGASTNVGSGSTAVGDFTTLLTSINPNLTKGGYPNVWTEFTITLSGLPAGGTSGRIAFRYFVTDGGPAGDNSNFIGIDSFSYLPLIGDPFPIAPLDYNGDGKTDYVVVRNTGGGSSGQSTWFIHNGTTDFETPWGIASDLFVSGDYDGDRKADITVYRPGVNSTAYFYSLKSSNGTLTARQLGAAPDDPTVVGDYDGDGRDDFAVYRSAAVGQQSFWYYIGSLTPNGGVTAVQWGQNGDYPAPGDYDGDGKYDFCVQRNDGSGQGVFFLNKSNGGTEALVWGTASDYIVPGDYDGDGRDDFAVVRGSGGQILWSVLGRNGNNIIHFGQPWGLAATDFPTQGDYDGDGKTDIAVWRPTGNSEQNYFFVRRSSNGALHAFEWGQQGDYPVANFNTH